MPRSIPHCDDDAGGLYGAGAGQKPGPALNTEGPEPTKEGRLRDDDCAPPERPDASPASFHPDQIVLQHPDTDLLRDRGPAWTFCGLEHGAWREQYELVIDGLGKIRVRTDPRYPGVRWSEVVCTAPAGIIETPEQAAVRLLWLEREVPGSLRSPLGYLELAADIDGSGMLPSDLTRMVRPAPRMKGWHCPRGSSWYAGVEKGKREICGYRKVGMKRIEARRRRKSGDAVFGYGTDLVDGSRILEILYDVMSITDEALKRRVEAGVGRWVGVVRAVMHGYWWLAGDWRAGPLIPPAVVADEATMKKDTDAKSDRSENTRTGMPKSRGTRTGMPKSRGTRTSMPESPDTRTGMPERSVGPSEIICSPVRVYEEQAALQYAQSEEPGSCQDPNSWTCPSCKSRDSISKSEGRRLCKGCGVKWRPMRKRRGRPPKIQAPNYPVNTR